MEEFITAIQENIKKQSGYSAKSNRLRSLIFSMLSGPSPKIRIIDGCNAEGDIRFEVDMKDMGISFDIYNDYKNDILIDFTASFIGELLVRENIEEFTKILMDLNTKDYYEIVNKYEHQKFGVKIYKNKFIFSFHISLLQSILFEDFKRKTVKYEQ